MTSTRSPETESAAHCRTATPKPSESTCTHAASLSRASNGLAVRCRCASLRQFFKSSKVAKVLKLFKLLRLSKIAKSSVYACCLRLLHRTLCGVASAVSCGTLWHAGLPVMQLRHPVHVRYRAMWEQHHALWEGHRRVRRYLEILEDWFSLNSSVLEAR